MTTVFLDGKFVEAGGARVSAFDAGIQHGVGLFETMLARRGEDGAAVVLHLPEHLERLRVSAAALGLANTLHLDPMGEAVRRTAARELEAQPTARVVRLRLTLTGGDLNLLRGGKRSEHQPTLLIVAQPAMAYPAELFERGAQVVVADFRANPFDPTQGHKTLNYWARLRELQNAAGKRADEALVFTVTNHVCGGCVSNAMVVKDGVVHTPIARGEEGEVSGADAGPQMRGQGGVLPSPVLPGIVRRWVLDWATSEGIEVRRRMLTLDDVLGADEVFLTNSSWGVLPVTRVESGEVGGGKAGGIATRLRGAWAELAG